MYKIIGGDGREYGPVDATTIRNWIAEGRLNADTRAQAVGAAEWRRVADFPEFADPFAPRPPVPEAPVIPPIPDAANAPSTPVQEASVYQSPAGYQVPVGGYEAATSYATTPGHLDIGSCFTRAWHTLNEQPAVIIGSAAVVLLIMLALGFIPFVGLLAGLFVNGPLFAGLMFVYLRCMRHQPVAIQDVFYAFGPRYLPLLVVNLVYGLLVVLGVLLCIVPGVYLAVAWMFATPLVLDRGMEFWPAMEESRRLAHPLWFPLFGLQLLGALLSVVGGLACLVGLFVTAPISVMAMLYAYEDLFGRPASTDFSA